MITVDWKVVSVHNVLYEGDPKSESSIREITIDDHTVQVLRDWRAVKGPQPAKTPERHATVLPRRPARRVAPAPARTC